jgi:hypothetical protein
MQKLKHQTNFHAPSNEQKELQMFNYIAEKEENPVYFSLVWARIYESASTQMKNQFYLKDYGMWYTIGSSLAIH